MDFFHSLLQYKAQFGSCDVPDKWHGDTKLSNWVGNQRQARKRETLKSDRITKLDAIGFNWEPKDGAWQLMFSALVAYRQQHGHYSVPKNNSENSALGTWVSWQRHLWKTGKLIEDRIHQLDAIQFNWENVDNTWEEMFAALTDYKQRFGDCNVPQKWAENRQLGAWIATQRQTQRKGKLSADCVKRLNDLGFAWEARVEHWEQMVTTLVEYKREHKDCNVPQDYLVNPQLGTWLSKQRAAMQKGNLSPSRKLKLEEIGVVANLIDTVWERMFVALAEYNVKYGDCNVPSAWPANQKLANWVTNQRQFKRKGNLQADRCAKLESLGFVWDMITSFWESMFEALVEYKTQNGNCKVPATWKANPQMALWVVNQRQMKKKGKLSEDRILRLDELGFRW